MDEWESYAYKKIKQDFAVELEFLDKGIDTLEKCLNILIKEIPILHKPNLSVNLKSSKPATRRSVAWVLLLRHAVNFLRSVRFLILNGYISPSLACLRVTVESILSAHVCKQSNKQTMKWINFEEIKRSGFRYPREFPKSTTQKIMKSLHAHGAHPNYSAFGTQGYYPGIIFTPEYKQEYEFFILRNIHLSLLISSRFLKYLLNKKPELNNAFPNGKNIFKILNVKTTEIGKRLKQNLRGILSYKSLTSPPLR